MQPTAKSLILDLLSTLGRRSAPVRALVAAGRLFEIRENGLRVALARLLADGLVERDERGRYRLGPRAQAVSAQLRSWRRMEDELVRWDGAWVAVHTGALGGGARARSERARALRFLGFRTLGAGLELRPDNLSGGVARVRRELLALGCEPHALVFALGQLDPAADARARALWDTQALHAGYRVSRDALERSAARLTQLSRDAAMVESFRVGGRAIRQVVLDPLLPEPIVEASERRALVDSLRRYDALGRAAWSGWLGDGRRDAREWPAGSRRLETAERLLPVAEEVRE